ncbi:hypothetical protein THRCLA_21025 [Thraustotheca clavata]|uniref:Uncharacterized protein n=1 Tax=Thraustotheca clavata TaxID=74557 RepID=A0A1W0A0Z0_9STRA|nr:hypothetical protein THRCLA_21025 [Thraustotheca clavata]
MSRQNGGDSGMVWGGIWSNGKTKLAFLNGTQNSIAYTKTLSDYLLPAVRHYFGEDFLFQQNNASVHTSKYTKAFLTNMKIPTMLWTPLSPDLNPIENVWGYIAHIVYANGCQNLSKEDIEICILNAWSQVSVDPFATATTAHRTTAMYLTWFLALDRLDDLSLLAPHRTLSSVPLLTTVANKLSGWSAATTPPTTKSVTPPTSAPPATTPLSSVPSTAECASAIPVVAPTLSSPTPTYAPATSTALKQSLTDVAWWLLKALKCPNVRTVASTTTQTASSQYDSALYRGVHAFPAVAAAANTCAIYPSCP